MFMHVLVASPFLESQQPQPTGSQPTAARRARLASACRPASRATEMVYAPAYERGPDLSERIPRGWADRPGRNAGRGGGQAHGDRIQGAHLRLLRRVGGSPTRQRLSGQD
jgi:hypothetical protein